MRTELTRFALRSCAALSLLMLFAQGSGVAQESPQVGLNSPVLVPPLPFDGIAAGPLNGINNPDVNGAVGDTQFVQWQNARGQNGAWGQYAVYDKTTGNQLGLFAGGQPWKGLGGACPSLVNSAQNIVQYDKAAKRWVMLRHVYPKTPPNYLCIAVSQTSDATMKWNKYAYALGSSAFCPTCDPSDQLDYPKLGVWPDAYYMSFNLRTSSSPSTFINAEVCAFDRQSMLAGGTAAHPVCFNAGSTYSSLLPSDLDGSTSPPTGSPNYYMNLGANFLNLWQFHVDFGTPSKSTFTGPNNIAVASFMQACPVRKVCIPQLGTTQLLRAWSDRLMYRLAYRNFGDHESIVTAHAVNPTTNAYSAIRWYEIRSPGSSPTIYQGGTWQPDDTSRWMMSIAMDKVGDIAVGYSESSGSQYPAIAFTGRTPTDPPGFETPEVIISPACPTGQTCNQVFNPGWGSYTSMSVDPVDDCTFWYTNQYYIQQGSKIWNTRIASFKFPSCQ